MQNSFQNAINMKADLLFLHQDDSFENKDLIKELRNYPLHIYMICRSPRIYIENSKTIIAKDKITLTFYTLIMGKRKEITIETINRIDQPIDSIQSDYPYNIIKAYKADGSEHSIAKANILLRILASQNGIEHKELDFEVLYTGQAFGEKGERITIDRLRNHEKAQKIYFETQNKFPDYEVWYVSLTFKPILITMFNSEDLLVNSIDDEIEKQIHLESNPISFDQQITILEASLIKYFNTKEYNKEYLDFTSITHKSYDECYKLDFNSTAFELTSKSIHGRFWSKSVKPSFYHYKNYFLHNDNDRKDMFEWYK